jgi:hypothetical protein
MLEYQAALVGERFDIDERLRRVVKKLPERLLAVLEPARAQIVAVAIEQVEGEELQPFRVRIAELFAQQVEIRLSLRVEDDRFAVDDTVLVAQEFRCLDDGGELMCAPVEAAA